MKPKAISIILGRKGSKGVPGKNTMLIKNIPAYQYPILASKNSNYITKTFVSTDHEEIIKGAKKMDANIIERPKSLCTDNALFEDALVHGYETALKRINFKPKYVVILMCNAITINKRLIDCAISMLEENKEADSVVTVSIFNMYSPLRARKLNENGYLEPFVPFETFGDPENLNCDRDSQGDSYFADMSHTVCRAECIENIKEGLLPQKWMGKKILPLLNQNGCDIDASWQIDMSKRWLEDNKL